MEFKNGSKLESINCESSSKGIRSQIIFRCCDYCGVIKNSKSTQWVNIYDMIICDECIDKILSN